MDRTNPPAAPFISLILVTYNSAGLLDAFFAALGSTRDIAYEVIVVDNASQDSTVPDLRQLTMPVRVVANTENYGFGRACNQGAALARGDFLVFLNPDVLVTPDWLTLLVEHLAQRPDAAIICPTTLYPDQQWEPSATAVAEEAAVPGCAMMVRRAAWQELGGFDEHIFLYWEDTELCWRAWLLGWSVLADLQAYVYHERGGSTGGRRWDGELMQNALYTHLKLMRWRYSLPYIGVAAVKTLGKAIAGRRGLLGAWRWNLRALPTTLRERARVRRLRRGDPALLEQRIVQHTRRLRQERLARSSGGAHQQPDAAARMTHEVSRHAER